MLRSSLKGSYKKYDVTKYGRFCVYWQEAEQAGGGEEEAATGENLCILDDCNTCNRRKRARYLAVSRAEMIRLMRPHKGGPQLPVPFEI